MLPEVEIGSVGDAFKLLPVAAAEGKLVLDINAGLGVMRQLIGGMGPQAEVVFLYAEVGVPVEALLFPGVPPVVIGTGLAEEFELSLLEFACSENKGLCGDFISEALSYLCDSEGDFDAGGVEYIGEIGEDSLGGFGAKKKVHRIVNICSHFGFEHEPEGHGVGKPADRAAAWADFAAQIGGVGHGYLDGHMLGMLVGVVFEVVNPGPGVALFAFGNDVGKFVGVTAGLPDQRVHEDAAIEAYHVIPHLDDSLPPGPLDVVFELDAEGAVVVAACQAAIDFTGLEYKTSSPAKRYDIIKPGDFRHIFILQENLR
jgi:hypothetical protein